MEHRVWLISEFYYPVVVTTGYYVTEIAEYMARKGMKVGVITTNNTYYATDVISDKEHEVHNGVEIFRNLGIQVEKEKLTKRVVRLFSSSVSLFKLAKNQIKKGDEVIILTNPAFFMLFMPMIRKITGCRYHILVHDIFPENLASLGKVGQKSFLYAGLKKIFDWAYTKADSCISIGCDMSEVIKGKTKNCKQISLITNWADVDEVTPMQKKDTNLYKELEKNLGDKLIFQFAGNLGRAQGLDNILNAIGMVDSEDVRFLFVGAGAKGEDVKTFAETHKNTVYAGFRDRSTQNDFINASDIGIVTLADGMFGLGVPSKSYNIMATGKPILYIGHERSEVARYMKEYNVGWAVRPNDPEALAAAIKEIVANKDLIKEKGENALKAAHNVFAKNVVLEQYYQFVKQQFEKK